MADIYKGELQDNKGNTVYPHTEADVVFCSDGERVQEKLAKTEEVLGDSTGKTGSLEVNDSQKLVTSDATYQLAQNQGGCSLSYNESEDAYYIQHGADSVPKKLGEPEFITQSRSISISRTATTKDYSVTFDFPTRLVGVTTVGPSHAYYSLYNIRVNGQTVSVTHGGTGTASIDGTVGIIAIGY